MKGAALRVLLLYGAFNALMQFEWLRFAPVTDATAQQYGVSVGAVGWLSLVFPLLFLPLALPAGALIDRWSVRRSLRVVALTMLAGTVLRAVWPGFVGLVAGQLVIALAQPLVMALIARLARVWFAPEKQLQATSVGTLALFVGLALAFMLLPTTATMSIAATQRIDVLVLLAFTLLSFTMLPADPPTIVIDAGLQVAPKAARTLIRHPLPILFALIFLGNGYFNAIFTWLEPMLGANGIDAGSAGLVALAMLAGGVAGMAVVPIWPALRQRLSRTLIVATLIGIPLTLLLNHLHAVPMLGLVGVGLGALMLAPLPLLVDTVAETAGATHAGIAVATFWLAGNAGAASIIYAFSQLADRGLWNWAGLALAALLGCETLLAPLLRKKT